eukprot:4923669-Pyramimonas_sp.AAC.1
MRRRGRREEGARGQWRRSRSEEALPSLPVSLYSIIDMLDPLWASRVSRVTSRVAPRCQLQVVGPAPERSEGPPMLGQGGGGDGSGGCDQSDGE